MAAQEVPAIKGVSIGGGTGQPNAIRALRGAGCSVSAIVAMADDGGSTGLLREETGLNPPGDIRKCLVAMADDPQSPLARAFEHRFGFGDNHTLGNLLIAALAEETGSFVRAVAECNRMLGCHGSVFPSTLDDVILCGTTRDGLEFRGESTLGTGPCALSRVWLSPRQPAAYEPAVRAILEADIVVLGPGSLFTSVIPNLLVPDVLEALKATAAPKVYVCSMADMQGESWGLTAEEYVDALLSHGLEGHLDAVLLHRSPTMGTSVATKCFQALTQEQVRSDAARRAAELMPQEGSGEPDWYFRPVQVDDGQIARIEARVPLVVVRDFTDPEFPTWHSLPKLTSVLKGVICACPSRQR